MTIRNRCSCLAESRVRAYTRGQVAGVKINQVRDFVERVAWSAIQAAAGALLAVLVSGHVVIWQAVLYAALIAALKVIVAQRTGSSSLGDAIPGGVIEGAPRG